MDRKTTTRLGRLFTITALCTGLAGCLLSPQPALPPGSGQDIGATLTFEHYRSLRETGPAQIDRYERTSGHVYRYTDSKFGTFDRVDILVLGKRGADTVYLVQMNANPEGSPETDVAFARDNGFLYTLSLLAVRKDGIGAYALLPCHNAEVAELAAKHGFTLDCSDSSFDGYLARATHAPDDKALLSFMRDALSVQSLPWEDRVHKTILEYYQD